MQLLLWFLMFLPLNLYLNLYNHSLLAVKCLVFSSVLSFFWKSLYRLTAFCRTHYRQRVPSFYSYHTPKKLRHFFQIQLHFITRYAVTFAVIQFCNPYTRSLSPSKSGWRSWFRVKWTVTLRLQGGGSAEIFLRHLHGAKTAMVGPGPLCIEASRLYLGTTQLVVLLWTSDQPCAETSTWWDTTHHSSKRASAHPHIRLRDHSESLGFKTFKDSNSVLIAFLKSLRLELVRMNRYHLQVTFVYIFHE
jgi:hypothetical protein